MTGRSPKQGSQITCCTQQHTGKQIGGGGGGGGGGRGGIGGWGIGR